VIFHICRSDNEWPPQQFLKVFAKELNRRFFTIHIEQLAYARTLPCGTYLFTDFERVTPEQVELLGQLWDQLSAHPEKFRLLNSPHRVLGRLELLRRLSEAGINDYRAFRLDDLPSDLRFPVFLRLEDNHEGSLTPLIENERDLEEAAVRVLIAGATREKLMVVEFCDTRGEDGLFRKYSVFKIGDRLVPRHLVLGRSWILKRPDMIDEEKLEEEREFLEGDPHREEISRIFELAQVEYGRIDYGLKEGRIQVWEINTNPIVTLSLQEYKPAHLPAQWWFAERAQQAFEELDSISETGTHPIELRWPTLLQTAAIGAVGSNTDTR
jgi:hypothetical protein